MLVLFSAAFYGYLRAERTTDRAGEERYESFLLASEARQSSDDLTRMVRTYVVTGNPLFKEHYQEILGIRNGTRPRPVDSYNVYWDLVLDDDRRPRPFGQTLSMAVRMREAGITPDELAMLQEAGEAADFLARIDGEAMALVEGPGPPPAAARLQAIAMLHDQTYRNARASLMGPIGEFLTRVDRRTLGAVRIARRNATVLRLVLVGAGLGLLFLLWRLLESIQGEARELLGYRDHLEQLVAVRTEELEHRNRQLNHEIAAREQAEEHIRKMAFNDPLTQLPNRRFLVDRLQGAMAQARRAGTRIALLFMDLDNFKAVNDQMGHGTGDQLLQAVARRLLECLREYDTAARFGGDEFVIMLTDLAQPGDALGVAERIRSALERPHRTEEGLELRISSSIGLAFYPDHAEDGRGLLQAGDEAMYQAKRGGRNRIVLYRPQDPVPAGEPGPAAGSRFRPGPDPDPFISPIVADSV
jgi:diguanylate cyclase (GGDEF)-like protein